MTVTPTLAPESSLAPPRVGLTLSGGGFRATLFHLGVVRFLYEEGLLHKVTHICSVSGGSILAAHLGLNWERYTSDKSSDFDAAVGELVNFIRSDLRGRVLRSWLFSWAALGLPRVRRRWWWRTHILQREYDRLYHGAKLKDLVSPSRPQLHLLATSFTTGHLVTFGQGEMRFCGDPVPDPAFMPADEVPVALAVTASSAFPPMFPPVRVDHATFGAPKDMFPNRHYMTDGGVYDNLGIRRLLWLFQPEERLEMIVVSDAQRSLAKEYGHEYNMTLGRTTRCVDLMMNRVSWFENSAAHEAAAKVHGRYLYIGLPKQPEHALKKAYAPSPPEQFAVATARTDLDAFSDDEIDAIIHEGYAAARAEAEHNDVCAAWPPGKRIWHPARPDRPAGYQLEGIDRRKLGLFRPGHWATWALWGLVALWAAIPVSLYLAEYTRAGAAEEQLHMDQHFKAVRMLGEVALSTKDNDRYRSRKGEWEEFEKVLSGDPRFHPLLKSEDLKNVTESVIRQPPPFPGDPKKDLRKLAKLVRDQLEAHGDKPFRKFQQRTNPSLYQELFDCAEQITKFHKLTQVKNSRRQFWRLYWGPVILVQGQETAAALEAYAETLREWEDLGKDPPDYDAVLPPVLKARLLANFQRMCKEFEKELGSQLTRE